MSMLAYSLIRCLAVAFMVVLGIKGGDSKLVHITAIDIPPCG